MLAVELSSGGWGRAVRLAPRSAPAGLVVQNESVRTGPDVIRLPTSPSMPSMLRPFHPRRASRSRPSPTGPNSILPQIANQPRSVFYAAQFSRVLGRNAVGEIRLGATVELAQPCSANSFIFLCSRSRRSIKSASRWMPFRGAANLRMNDSSPRGPAGTIENSPAIHHWGQSAPRPSF